MAAAGGGARAAPPFRKSKLALVCACGGEQHRAAPDRVPLAACGHAPTLFPVYALECAHHMDTFVYSKSSRLPLLWGSGCPLCCTPAADARPCMASSLAACLARPGAQARDIRRSGSSSRQRGGRAARARHGVRDARGAGPGPAQQPHAGLPGRPGHGRAGAPGPGSAQAHRGGQACRARPFRHAPHAPDAHGGQRRRIRRESCTSGVREAAREQRRAPGTAH